jgi:hypothetical protein
MNVLAQMSGLSYAQVRKWFSKQRSRKYDAQPQDQHPRGIENVPPNHQYQTSPAQPSPLLYQPQSHNDFHGFDFE